MRRKTEEEERQDLLRGIKTDLRAQGRGKDGKNAALKLLLELEGFTQNTGKELFVLTADDYHLIEQQAKKELDDGIPPYIDREGEVSPELQLLHDQLCLDNGQEQPTEDNPLETLDLSSLPE